MGAIPVCVSPVTPSPPLLSPSWHLGLLKLFNDAVSFFHINLCPENWPLLVLPRRRVFTQGLFCGLQLAPLCGEKDWHPGSGVGTGLGEAPGDSLVDFLNFQNDLTNSPM